MQLTIEVAQYVKGMCIKEVIKGPNCMGPRPSMRPNPNFTKAPFKKKMEQGLR